MGRRGRIHITSPFSDERFECTKSRKVQLDAIAAEIVDDLKTALAEFKAIQEDLATSTANV